MYQNLIGFIARINRGIFILKNGIFLIIKFYIQG